MAITPTGAIFKTLSFDGESLRSYGVYISGEATFNAPAREVEMISIPGRSGQLALDKGRFENIEVTYPAGIYADTEEDFAEAVSELRNYLCSRSGYCRIEDDYNPNEFRMGIYKSGLEVTPAQLRAGEFEIIFDCKPQRYLTSGESAISVDSGDVISNPTLFESSPLLEVEGYGNIDISGQSIEVLDATLDEQVLHNEYTPLGTFVNTITVDLDQNLNAISAGDSFYVDGVKVTEITTFTQVPQEYPNIGWLRIGADYPQTPGSAITQTEGLVLASNMYQLSWKYQRLQFVYGTPSTTPNYVGEVEYYFPNGGAEFLAYRPYTFYAEYDGDKQVTFHIDGTESFTISTSYVLSGTIQRTVTIPKIIGIPSLSNLAKNIDLEMGECYAYLGDKLISWNNSAILPSDLPKLASGANTITFDNTVTDLKVVPRWWKI